MIKWNYPEINEPYELFITTDEMLSAWELEYKRCNEANTVLIESLREMQEELISKAIDIWGEHSNQVKYLKKQSIFSPSKFDFSDLKRKVIKAKEDHEQKTKALENSNAYDRLTEKAINWLSQHNFVVGEDFTIHGAIEMANTIAYEDEVKRLINEIKVTGDFVTFWGNDCCEKECAGWDGESNRCDCGASRVSWDNEEIIDFFLDPNIHGRSY